MAQFRSSTKPKGRKFAILHLLNEHRSVYDLTILTGTLMGVVFLASLGLQGTRSRDPTSTRVMRSRVMSRGDFLKYGSSALILLFQRGLFTSKCCKKPFLSLFTSLSMLSPLLLMKILLCCTKVWTTTGLLLEAKSSVNFGTRDFLNN